MKTRNTMFDWWRNETEEDKKVWIKNYSFKFLIQLLIFKIKNKC